MISISVGPGSGDAARTCADCSITEIWFVSEPSANNVNVGTDSRTFCLKGNVEEPVIVGTAKDGNHIGPQPDSASNTSLIPKAIISR